MCSFTYTSIIIFMNIYIHIHIYVHPGQFFSSPSFENPFISFKNSLASKFYQYFFNPAARKKYSIININVRIYFYSNDLFNQIVSSSSYICVIIIIPYTIILLFIQVILVQLARLDLSKTKQIVRIFFKEDFNTIISTTTGHESFQFECLSAAIEPYSDIENGENININTGMYMYKKRDIYREINIIVTIIITIIIILIITTTNHRGRRSEPKCGSFSPLF
jgi:hypothetical protein